MPNNITDTDLVNVAREVETTLGINTGLHGLHSIKAVLSIDASNPHDRTFFAVAHYPALDHYVVVQVHRTGNVVIGDPLPTMGQALTAIAAVVDAVPDTAEAEPDPILDAA